MNIKISQGNIKLGRIANFNLPPIRTCSSEACKTCAVNGCYALKSYKMYKQTRNAYDWNYDICRSNLSLFKSDMIEFLNKYKKNRFRIHSSGDFFSKEYFSTWIELIRQFPDIQFLAYTKQFDNIHSNNLPDNFALYISEWDKEIEDHPTLPRASMIESWNDSIDTFVCTGDCRECSHCYTGRNVVFIKH